jgi:carbon monoxide dehydrogenase subunit G
MAKISLSKTLSAPVDRVFQAFTEFDRVADRIDAIQSLEVLTDGPTGVGTRFRETRIVFKKEATEEMVITSFDAPHSYTVGCESCGAVFETVYRFLPEGPGGESTRVELDFEAKPVTFFAKLMSPLSALMSKSCAKSMGQDIEDLRKVVEQPQPASV